MAKLKPYVMSITDSNSGETHVILYGPFKSMAAAAKWGNRNCSDPRWNGVMFTKNRLGANTLLVPIITSGGN